MSILETLLFFTKLPINFYFLQVNKSLESAVIRFQVVSKKKHKKRKNNKNSVIRTIHSVNSFIQSFRHDCSSTMTFILYIYFKYLYAIWYCCFPDSFPLKRNHIEWKLLRFKYSARVISFHHYDRFVLNEPKNFYQFQIIIFFSFSFFRSFFFSISFVFRLFLKNHALQISDKDLWPINPPTTTTPPHTTRP